MASHNCWYCNDSYRGMPAYEAKDEDGDNEWRYVCPYHGAAVECSYVECGRTAWRPEDLSLPSGWVETADPGKYICPDCAYNSIMA